MGVKLLVPSAPSAHELLFYLKKVDETRWYSNFGPLVQTLESRLSEHYGGAHVVTVANCTLGLELVWARIRAQWPGGPPPVACLPALTFPATALAAHRAGFHVRLVDVDPHTWTAPWVSGFGLPETGSPLDAAGAFGEQRVARTQTAVFSLHATKPLGAGEGGYIVTWDAQAAKDYRRMSNFGLREGISLGYGTNAKMSEYHAAVALAALDRWDRRPWLQLYDWFADLLPAGVIPQKRPRGVYSLMPVLLPCPAQPVLERLRKEGIEARRWYNPVLAVHPLFALEGWQEKLPVTARLSERLLGLPYHLSLTEGDVAIVCDALRRAVRRSKPADSILPRHEVVSAA